MEEQKGEVEEQKGEEEKKKGRKRTLVIFDFFIFFKI